MKKILKIIFEYSFLGIKILIAFLFVLFQNIFLAFGYFLFDLIHSFYEKYQNNKDKDISVETQDLILSEVKKNSENNEKLADEQRKYNKKTEKTKKSLVVLNKLLTDSEIRQSELFKISGTSQFYQIFVYSASLNRLNKTLMKKFNFDMQVPNRQYPIFLKDLGFARMGKSNPIFLINKNNLKNQKLLDVKNFKKFLMYHFSKIKKQEWNEYLNKIKDVNNEAFNYLKDKNNLSESHLLINFLITESNINITNIGYVDHKHIGLADVKNNGDINNQFMLNKKIDNVSDLEEIKVKIKKIIERQDLSILLQDIEIKDKNLILSEQDNILDNLKIKNILSIESININDFKNELIKLGFEEDKSDKISQRVFKKVKEFNDAMKELNINL